MPNQPATKPRPEARFHDEDQNRDSAEREILNTAGLAKLLMVSDRVAQELARSGAVPELGISSSNRFHREGVLEWLRERGRTTTASRLASLTTPANEPSESDGEPETDEAR